MEDDLQVLDCGGYFTVVNRAYHAEYDNHTHFKNRKGAEILKKLVEQMIVPHSKYLAFSAYRVTINPKYKNKIVEKWKTLK